MTKKLDPEEKRRRKILRDMAAQGRWSDYVSTLTDEQRQEAYEVQERMNAEYSLRRDRAHRRGHQRHR